MYKTILNIGPLWRMMGVFWFEAPSALTTTTRSPLAAAMVAARSAARFSARALAAALASSCGFNGFLAG